MISGLPFLQGVVSDKTPTLWLWVWETIPSKGGGQTSPDVPLAGTQLATLTLFKRSCHFAISSESDQPFEFETQSFFTIYNFNLWIFKPKFVDFL